MTSDIIAYILIILAIVIIALLVFLIQKATQKPEKDESQALLLQQMNELSRTVDSKIGESQKIMSESVSDQFNKSQDLIQNINRSVTEHLVNVTKGVTEANEASKQIFSVAEGLKDLEQVLKHQKQRGNLGEKSLQLILENILPPEIFQMQYRFKDGDTVDAIIKTKEGIIPIDAKFSLDNYTRLMDEKDEVRIAELEKQFRNDLKKRIDETANYIRPKDGTLPVALMFIPAEGIYYDLLVNEVGGKNLNARNLIEYAQREKQVTIVSPTTLYAYLIAILNGFRAFKVEENVKDIIKYVEQLQKHLKSYEDYHTKLGNTIGTVVNHYNRTGKEFQKIDKDVLKITGKSMEIDTPVLDKPEVEE